MAIQSAVACSEVIDDGLLVSWQLMECVLVWVVSSSIDVGDNNNTNNTIDFISIALFHVKHTQLC